MSGLTTKYTKAGNTGNNGSYEIYPGQFIKEPNQGGNPANMPDIARISCNSDPTCKNFALHHSNSHAWISDKVGSHADNGYDMYTNTDKIAPKYKTLPQKPIIETIGGTHYCTGDGWDNTGAVQVENLGRDRYCVESSIPNPTRCPAELGTLKDIVTSEWVDSTGSHEAYLTKNAFPQFAIGKDNVYLACGYNSVPDAIRFNDSAMNKYFNRDTIRGIRNDFCTKFENTQSTDCKNWLANPESHLTYNGVILEQCRGLDWADDPVCITNINNTLKSTNSIDIPYKQTATDMVKEFCNANSEHNTCSCFNVTKYGDACQDKDHSHLPGCSTIVRGIESANLPAGTLVKIGQDPFCLSQDCASAQHGDSNDIVLPGASSSVCSLNIAACINNFENAKFDNTKVNLYCENNLTVTKPDGSTIGKATSSASSTGGTGQSTSASPSASPSPSASIFTIGIIIFIILFVISSGFAGLAIL
jgi:hypothetical protein